MPIPVDQPWPGTERPPPRRFNYEPGWNLPQTQPGEGYLLAPFSALKSLSRHYSIARRCIEIRKKEITGLDWDIVLTSHAQKAYQGKPSMMRDFGERRAKAMRFFRKPDRNYFTFESWLSAVIEQVFTIDALSLWLCPKKGTGLGRGLLGSDLDRLWTLDGETIRPLLDLHGATPEPPAPGYQAYYQAVPRADFTTVINGLDLPELEGSEALPYRGDQLLYLPMVVRPDSPYGFSPTEQALTPILTGLRKQGMQLEFFTEGTVPAVYISPGDTTMTPNQIRELQDALNAVAGDQSWHWKIMVLPSGSKVLPQKSQDIVDQADEWIANEVAMMYGVNPMDLGILPKVSTVASPFAAREMAQASRSQQAKVDLKPLLKYLTANPNWILQDLCGQDDMELVFEGMREVADEAALTDMLVKQAQIGVRSVDEFRDKLNLAPWGLPESSGPVVFTPMGPIPLADAVAIASQTAQQKALPPGQSSSGGRNGKKKPATARSLPGGSVPARQRQRGGAALTPAHAASEGFMPERSPKKPSAAPAHAQAAVKAWDGSARGAHAELEALTRHLRRGREITTWEPRHLPERALGMIAEQMAKGADPGLAASLVKTLILPPASYEWVEKARHQSQQQSRQQRIAALEAKYAAQIQAAFTAAAGAAAALIAQWAAGTLAVTAAVLAGMIAALVLQHLRPVLERLWREAWRAGEKEAGDRDKAALAAFLDTWGRQVGEWVSDTSTAEIARLLHELAGLKRKRMIRELLRILEADVRSQRIAVSEITRAWNHAVLAIWRLLGVAEKGWRIADESACETCKKNQAQGWIPVTALFQSGDLAPGAHPHCRCHLVRRPAQEPPLAAKRRRGVNLDGEVVISAGDPEGGEDWRDNPAGGGGRTLYPHRADGTEVPGGVPGSSAGGEPPRWDASTPERRGYVNEYGDDDAQWPDRGHGVVPGPDEDFPDGGDEDEDSWPEGGHGTAQPPATPVGDGPRGRAPNAMGKAGKTSAAADFLRDAPAAKAGAVRKIMEQNFPPSALGWLKHARWVGPVDLPLDLVDMSGRKGWAASHEQDHVAAIAADMKAGKKINPAIMVIRPEHNHARLIDGRHRTLAAEKRGRPVRAYVGFLDSAAALKAAYDTYHQQFHAGDDPQNKSFTAGNVGGTTYGLTPLTVQGQQTPHRESCECCGETGEHETGHECYRCDASGYLEGSEIGSPFCEEVFRDQALHAKGCPNCGKPPFLGSGKVSKKSVRYRAADGAERCGTCSMFSAGTCSLVRGTISPDAVCDRWEPRGAARRAGPVAAGLAVRAADTGRVLMLQRAMTDDDPAAGAWEFPGGHVDDGEEPAEAAAREWAEETGCTVPDGMITGHWATPDGIYEGFVLSVPSEDDLPVFGDRDAVTNPDDPDGDQVEALAWWDPEHLRDNPAVRPELAASLGLALEALATAPVTKAAGGIRYIKGS